MNLVIITIFLFDYKIEGAIKYIKSQKRVAELKHIVRSCLKQWSGIISQSVCEDLRQLFNNFWDKSISQYQTLTRRKSSNAMQKIVFSEKAKNILCNPSNDVQTWESMSLMETVSLISSNKILIYYSTKILKSNFALSRHIASFKGT